MSEDEGPSRPVMGDVFADVERPGVRWEIVDHFGDVFVLASTQAPGARRHVYDTDLFDEQRYAPIRRARKNG